MCCKIAYEAAKTAFHEKIWFGGLLRESVEQSALTQTWLLP
jgi:hypothetical protein